MITGEEDEIAPVELIKSSLYNWNHDAHLEVIDYADHFYYGFFKPLEKAVYDYLSIRNKPGSINSP